jgi:hypothetical protein
MARERYPSSVIGVQMGAKGEKAVHRIVYASVAGHARACTAWVSIQGKVGKITDWPSC